MAMVNPSYLASLAQDQCLYNIPRQHRKFALLHSTSCQLHFSPGCCFAMACKQVPPCCIPPHVQSSAAIISDSVNGTDLLRLLLLKQLHTLLLLFLPNKFGLVASVYSLQGSLPQDEQTPTLLTNCMSGLSQAHRQSSNSSHIPGQTWRQRSRCQLP